MKRSKQLYLVLFTLVLILAGCKNQKKQMAKELAGFVGSEILIPNNMRVLLEGRDTLMEDDLLKAEMKIVVYNDTTGCSSCKISHLNEWNEMLDFTRKFDGKVSVVYVFSPSPNNVREVIIALKTYGFTYPVFLDETNAFKVQNACIPAGATYHTFLLDRENRVVLVGDPTWNENLSELYRKTIQEGVSQ